jgi:hypothetical protein
MTAEPDSIDHSRTREARRRFLLKCGRFAVVTPPAMVMLLSVGAMPRQAQAASGFASGGDHAGDDKHHDKHDHDYQEMHGDGWLDWGVVALGAVNTVGPWAARRVQAALKR